MTKMYKLIKHGAFESECVEVCSDLEELDEALQSHLLLTAHLGYNTRITEKGFDVYSQGDMPVLICYYRIEEEVDGKK